MVGAVVVAGVVMVAAAVVEVVVVELVVMMVAVVVVVAAVRKIGRMDEARTMIGGRLTVTPPTFPPCDDDDADQRPPVRKRGP